MKKLMIAFALVCSSSYLLAQSSKFDPTYSIHNYKHQNKALEASKELEANTQYLEETDVNARNYKAQNQTLESSGAVAATMPVEVNVNSIFSNQNYKSAFGAQKKEATEPKNTNNYVAFCKRNVRHEEFVKRSQNYKSQF